MAMKLLSYAGLSALPAESRPRITPGAAGPGIVHLGLGAFHRAHQAVYTEDAMVAAGGDWGVVGVAPRSYAVIGALAGQDRLYSVLSVGAGLVEPRVVGVHTHLLHAAPNPMNVVGWIGDP